MILILPQKPRLKLFDIDKDDHKEFGGLDLIGEPINIGVKNPKSKPYTYIIKGGYTYLWEPYNLYGGSKFYSIWLIYPKGKRPTKIEIEDYHENEIIDAVEYKKVVKSNRKKEKAVVMEKEKYYKYSLLILSELIYEKKKELSKEQCKAISECFSILTKEAITKADLDLIDDKLQDVNLDWMDTKVNRAVGNILIDLSKEKGI